MAKTSRKVQPKEKRIYVLDTCVLLHDPQSIYKFAEHDIYIPLAVIDDLDEQKTRQGSVGWSAREVFRILDTYPLEEMTGKGVEVNPQGGRLFVYNTEAPLQKNQIPNIVRVNSDNAIINTCKSLMAEFPSREIIMVTKDTGLRVRASSWGCKAENYRTDLIEIDDYTGVKRVPVDDSDDWSILIDNLEIPLNKLSPRLVESLNIVHPNEFVIFEYGTNRCPTRFSKGALVNLDRKNAKNADSKATHNQKNSKPKYSGIQAKNLEQILAFEILSDDEVPLNILHGKAGTGKTLLAIACALHKIMDEGKYKKMVIIKPLIAVGGHDIGALPGDKFEKISAWLGPMKDNIEQLVGYTKNPNDSFEEMVEDGRIEVEAMAFIQGRSIPNSIIIVDEAQNLTPRECRMVVERCGENSKVILLGDLSQVENPYLDARSCGLAHAIQGCKGFDKCGSVHLMKVERSKLAALATEIFNRPESMR